MMTRYSIKIRDRTFVEDHGLLLFDKNMNKNLIKI